jgi:hypothetical protein
VPVDGRWVLVRLRIRWMRCPVTECARQTFREQVPGLVERYQRRTVRLGEQVRGVVRELAGRASARLLPALGIAVGRDTAVRVLLGIPLPERPVPQVLGIDDFALRRGHDYATVVIDADTGARIDVLAGRGAGVVAGWLRTHPGVEVVCRDGSAAYAQAVRDALPNAVQVADRWHLWHGLCDAVDKEVAAHSACWATATGLREGKLAETTLQRWQQIHALLEAGVGLLDCSRRLGLAMNTVKRYARAATPERIQRVPIYRACMVDPYREHLRTRREQEPGVGATALLGENPRSGLHRQPQPPRALPQPGTAPRRPTPPLATPCRPAAADTTGEPHRTATRTPRTSRSGLPRDESPGKRCPVLRRPARSPGGPGPVGGVDRCRT